MWSGPAAMILALPDSFIVGAINDDATAFAAEGAYKPHSDGILTVSINVQSLRGK